MEDTYDEIMLTPESQRSSALIEGLDVNFDGVAGDADMDTMCTILVSL